MRVVVKTIYKIGDTYYNIANIFSISELAIIPNYGEPYAEGYINGIKVSCSSVSFADTASEARAKQEQFIKDYNTLLLEWIHRGDDDE